MCLGFWNLFRTMIRLKNKNEIKILREGGQKLAAILHLLKEMVEPGTSTMDLERRAKELIKKSGGRPSFKGYRNSYSKRPFPTALCASINEEIVHAPSLPPRYLKNGDIISIDLGMIYKGLFTDAAFTVAVGAIDEQTQKLVDVTKECLELAINQVRPGNKLFDIARAIQINAETNGFDVVRELVGHGVGYAVHEEPQVLNFVDGDKQPLNIKLEPGLVIALEPMVTAVDWRVDTKKNGFTISTKDGSLAAHFEHTVAVTEEGCLVITSVG